MGHGLHDLVRHNSWATAQLLAYCQGLDEATLQATVPGTYGSIIDTLRHLINSEASYLLRASRAWPDYPWDREGAAGLGILVERAAILADTWEQYLAPDEIDLEQLGEARGDEGEVFATPAATFITQAIHHGNEHRAQVCTILGALGYDTPDISVWEHAIVTGRMWLKSPDGT